MAVDPIVSARRSRGTSARSAAELGQRQILGHHGVCPRAERRGEAATGDLLDDGAARGQVGLGEEAMVSEAPETVAHLRGAPVHRLGPFGEVGPELGRERALGQGHVAGSHGWEGDAVASAGCAKRWMRSMGVVTTSWARTTAASSGAS